jgi:transcription initiation factor IIE alpha subunit
MAVDKVKLLQELQVQGKRLCPDCGGEVNDPDNMQVGADSIGPEKRNLSVVVRHITCPEE